MAPAPAPPSRRGLNWSNPGGREYLIVGGLVLGGALVYFWWRGRHPSPAAAAPADTSSGPATPTGLNTGQFLAWVRDHQSSTTTPAKPESKAQEAAEEKHEPKGT